MSDEIMTPDEVADYLKLSIRTIYRKAKEGSMPASKVDGVWRFQKSRIDAWLGSLENGARIHGARARSA